MGKKITLREIAPYLPYGLKAKLSKEGIFNLDSEYPNQYINEICTINNFYLINGEFSGSMVVDKSNKNYGFDFDNLSEVEIILRPLNDYDVFLMENFPTNEWCDAYTDIMLGVGNGVFVHQIPYELFEFLLKNHFDVFGLIEKGLAIDINTL